jgi:YebC/PmpR family DNA-binding regulatory protein
MSGHSHWSTIKRKKQSEDIKRGKVFSKLARAIRVAARQGGGDSDSNSSLRLAIDKARDYNMPKDKIEQAIERGSGGGGGDELAEATYEGYGPEGVAFMVKVLTDNKNRTLAEIRQLFEIHGGRIGDAGSASYIFNSDPENPSFSIPVTDREKAKKILALTNALDEHEDVQEVYSNFDIADELLSKLG